MDEYIFYINVGKDMQAVMKGLAMANGGAAKNMTYMMYTSIFIFTATDWYMLSRRCLFLRRGYEHQCPSMMHIKKSECICFGEGLHTDTQTCRLQARRNWLRARAN
eukprot:10072685-Heterocapsa_arctica.AAC.1